MLEMTGSHNCRCSHRVGGLQARLHIAARHSFAAVAVLMVALLWPQTLWAHGAPLDRAVTWHDWNGDPVILLNLSVILWLYCRGWTVLRGRRVRRSLVSPWRSAAFAGGMLALAFALVSPLDPLSAQLGWAHMVQHMILMTVAAPLLMAGSAALVCVCGLSPTARRGLARLRQIAGKQARRWLWSALVVWSLYGVVMWIWHVPVLYEAALGNELVHDLQHLTFFIVACLFWRVLLDPTGRRTLQAGLAVLYLFTTTLHATVLGVFMTIAPSPWYPSYQASTQWWGLTALEDQQLAGLIMWMPACAAYALVAIALFAKALEDRADEPCGESLKAMVVQ